MGTNYYVNINTCPTCKRPEKEIHLGKSSYGWKFSFQYNGGEYYKNTEEMKEWLKDKEIYDEDGEDVSYEDFWKWVEDKKDGLSHVKRYPSDSRSFSIDGHDFTDCDFS